jgi:hypothetical protein
MRIGCRRVFSRDQQPETEDDAKRAAACGSGVTGPTYCYCAGQPRGELALPYRAAG